jgi:hypothetical protein
MRAKPKRGVEPVSSARAHLGAVRGRISHRRQQRQRTFLVAPPKTATGALTDAPSRPPPLLPTPTLQPAAVQAVVERVVAAPDDGLAAALAGFTWDYEKV